MVYWNKWVRFKRRRNARLDKKSTAAPVNTRPPSITNGGNGLFLADRGDWDNYPTRFKLTWMVNGTVAEFGDSFISSANPASISLKVEASNDDGTTTLVV